MKNIIFVLTVFFALVCSAVTVSAATVTISSAVEENHVITVEGRVNNPAEDQRLVVMGCVMNDDGTYYYGLDVYMNNIAAPLDENGNFTLTLELADTVNFYDEYIYVIRIGGTDIEMPSSFMLGRTGEGDIFVLGDVNLDGNVTANDAALTLQYVLYAMPYITDEQVAAMRVTGTDLITADNAAMILMKSLDASFEFPVNE